MIICICANINSDAIDSCIREGACCLEEIQDSTGACTNCRCCQDCIEERLEDFADRNVADNHVGQAGVGTLEKRAIGVPHNNPLSHP